MVQFNSITKHISNDLENLEKSLKEVANSDSDFLNEVLNYVFESKGKRIRPALVYLTSRLFGEPQQSTHNAALVLELMHTATLLHDDVVDNAVLRRGKQTVNHKWDDKTAVLVGDYLFARAMKVAIDYNEYELFKIITPVIMNLSVGELQQMNNSSKFEVNYEKYYEIIKNKTASLISVGCKSGAISSGASKEEVETVERLGDILGIIFQIKDDILDYIGNGETGKETGVDIREGKITLPFILAWENMSGIERESIEECWKNAGHNRDCEKDVVTKVIEKGGIIESEKTLLKMKNDALEQLDKLPKTIARQALIELVDYIINRNK
ncbi:MAG TPA: polyprenyl synthetase family protein [Bacteroidales bacterium]|nr:polyprenyl synthetase family protein [Bacteroidales bacterium]